MEINDVNNMWKPAHEEAWKVNVEAMKLAESGKEVPMRMRLLANYEHQFMFLTWKRKHGIKSAEMLFDLVVERAEKEKLYDEFRSRQRKAGMPEGDIITIRTFLLHPNRAMEYAEFCEKQIEKLGLQFVTACGGMTCSYEQFDISRCREIANQM
jgi:hypothetical protein